MASKYKKVKLADGTTRDEHRLVMEAHLGRRLERNEVIHHKDGDKSNNALTNLELMSYRDHNLLHGWEKVQHKNQVGSEPPYRGSAAPNSKLTEDIVRQFKLDFKDSRKGLRKKARELGVQHSTLSKILDGKAWQHVN